MSEGLDNGMGKNDVEDAIQPGDRLPPNLSRSQVSWLCVCRASIALGISYLFAMGVCTVSHPSVAQKYIYFTYFALAGFLAGLVFDFVIRHKIRVHTARKEDRSTVEALIQEANSVQTRTTHPESLVDFEKKISQMRDEVNRLENKIRPEGWTEYQVLTLNQQLIDFLFLDDLKAHALSSLDELKEYAEGQAYSYHGRYYDRWEQRINKNINDIEELERKDVRGEDREERKKEKEEALRANLRSLIEHIADFQANWAEGSTIVTGIGICGSVSIVIFMLMGILPIVYSMQNGVLAGFPLGILNWGILGAAGATASALVGLRRTDEVEIGNTAGKQELWRMVWGAPLGFVSGILVVCIFRGGLVTDGSLVPDLLSSEWSDVYLAIAWSVIGGMGLERVFYGVREALDA